MVLHLIGLGLTDEKDITLKGLEIVKRCEAVYLEAYTSIMGVDKSALEALYDTTIQLADRSDVEEGCDVMIKRALLSDVALLVVGDPLCATTHGDLVLRAKEQNVVVNVVHNASIVSAVGVTGLQIYRFGEIVSIPFFDGQWRPESFYDKLKTNKDLGLHTLCLLDIKVKEQTPENLMRGKPIYEPPRYMSIRQCIEQLLEVEAKKQLKVCSGDVKAFGLARIGSSTQKIVSGSLNELAGCEEFGGPLHSLVICSETLHDIENSFFELYRAKPVVEKP
eukprot:GHVQ01025319.1.p1 GENE.GHVQ01025319.1~~GHVQ01025319.1.p1  ORF type:complete len:278 (+),score=26.12 GHVQ01025319.1:328-1161(+)